VAAELDLKKAARAVGEKSIAMIHVTRSPPLTGYVPGGCSPVGMKKRFPTVFGRVPERKPTMLVSGGRIGTQIEVAPADLIALVRGKTADLTTGE
jgi:Cys-tRNA(Pro)/Cys-tRNA(Cys) deacylase